MLDLNPSPLFSEINIQKDALHFRSQRIPPITELGLIAERFDVSYDLHYQIAGEDQASYKYVCLQHEALDPAAEQVREFINRARTETQLRGTERLLDEFLLNRSFSLRELGLFSCLLKKQLAEINRRNLTGRTPWESDDLSEQSKRGR
jgi:hypothetical protein